MVGDVANGSIVILVTGILISDDYPALVAGALAFTGHNWPIFLQFKGGRGAATTMGVLVALAPKVTLHMIFVSGVLLLRYRRIKLVFALLFQSLPIFLWYFRYPNMLVVYAIGLAHPSKHSSNHGHTHEVYGPS